MHEIKFYGRGGQGVVLASQMLGLAFLKAGLYPQCYSLFGGERRGAPLVSFLRVDRGKILLKCEIRHPGLLLCFDESLIDQEEIGSLRHPGGRILVNARHGPEGFDPPPGPTWGIIDAGTIAESLGLGNMINCALLGAYCRFTGDLSIDYLIDAIQEMVPAKIEANVEAARQGYAGLALYGEKG